LFVGKHARFTTPSRYVRYLFISPQKNARKFKTKKLQTDNIRPTDLRITYVIITYARGTCFFLAGVQRTKNSFVPYNRRRRVSLVQYGEQILPTE